MPLLKTPDINWDFPSVTSLSAKQHAVRDERWRYISYGNGEEELYDHKSDALEHYNLAKNKDFDAVKLKLAEWIPTKNAPSVSGNKDPRGTGLDRKAPKHVVKYE